MPDPKHQSSRDQQRARTKRDIVAAARRLMESGEVPTVRRAAEEARVSRATAYRYFASQAELLAAVMKEQMQVTQRIPERAGNDVSARVEAVIRADYRLRRRFETQSRVWLRIVAGRSPDDELEVERGWRLPPLATALESLPESVDRTRLMQALSVLVGPEPFVILKDLWGIEGDEASEILVWAGRALVEMALAEAEARPEA